jgi:effector-binding domain-containing protein
VTCVQPIEISVRTVPGRTLAAVRRRVTIAEIGKAWRPALDQVWAFLRARPGLRTDGHNVFVYHHPRRRSEPMDVDFGVEVVAAFEPAGEVVAAATPAGEVAMAVHVGSYDGLHRAHDAIHAWSAREDRALGDTSWEIHGDWSDDPAKLETTVCYLLG